MCDHRESGCQPGLGPLKGRRRKAGERRPRGRRFGETAGGREGGERPGSRGHSHLAWDRRPGVQLLGPQVWGPEGRSGGRREEALLSYSDARAPGGEEGQNFRLFT